MILAYIRGQHRLVTEMIDQPWNSFRPSMNRPPRKHGKSNFISSPSDLESMIDIGDHFLIAQRSQPTVNKNPLTKREKTGFFF
jgi:hypothetical protein